MWRLLIEPVILSALFVGFVHRPSLSKTDALPSVEIIFSGSIAGRNGIEVIRSRIDGKECLILFAYPHSVGITCDWKQP